MYLPHRESFSPAVAYHVGSRAGIDFLQGVPVFAVLTLEMEHLTGLLDQIVQYPLLAIPHQGICMKLSINRHRKCKRCVVLAQALTQYLCGGLSFS